MIRVISKKEFRQKLGIDLGTELARHAPVESVKELYGAPFSYIHRLEKYKSQKSAAQYLADHEDRWVLLSLLLFARPERILEMGTERGKMTALLALLSAPQARVWTVDLPPRETHGIQYAWEADYPKGEHINLFGAGHKVTQVFCDSRKISAQNLPPMDFCFIDGNHDYDFVRADSEYALAQLRKPAVLVWHDYKSEEPGVRRYLHELSQHMPLYRVAGSWMMLMVFALVGYEHLNLRRQWLYWPR